MQAARLEQSDDAKKRVLLRWVHAHACCGLLARLVQRRGQEQCAAAGPVGNIHEPAATAAVPSSFGPARLSIKRAATHAAAPPPFCSALERIPQSVRLWKAVVEISEEDDARVLLVSVRLCRCSAAVRHCPPRLYLQAMLPPPSSWPSVRSIPAAASVRAPLALWPCAVNCCPQHVPYTRPSPLHFLPSMVPSCLPQSRAVECCPQHVELWMALARLETYENARKVGAS